MESARLTCDLIGDGAVRVTEEVSGHVFNFRHVNGQLDVSSARVVPGANADARPADFYSEGALLDAGACFMRGRPSEWADRRATRRNGTI
jgi:hypothetical protein